MVIGSMNSKENVRFTNISLKHFFLLLFTYFPSHSHFFLCDIGFPVTLRYLQSLQEHSCFHFHELIIKGVRNWRSFHHRIHRKFVERHFSSLIIINEELINRRLLCFILPLFNQTLKACRTWGKPISWWVILFLHSDEKIETKKGFLCKCRCLSGGENEKRGWKRSKTDWIKDEGMRRWRRWVQTWKRNKKSHMKMSQTEINLTLSSVWSHMDVLYWKWRKCLQVLKGL